MMLPDPYTLISIVSAAIYLILLTGILILSRRHIARLVDIIRKRRRLDPSRSMVYSSAENDDVFSLLGILNRHLDGLLSVTMKRPVMPTVFLAICIGMFFIVFTASASNLSMSVSSVVALSFAALPYLGLRIRLERMRRRGSYEGENLVASFLTQYWISGGNIYGAMERTLLNTKNIPVTGGLLTEFLVEARSTGNSDRIRAAERAFSYGVGTHWAGMLAYNIGSALRSGGDISLAIEDILSQLREARALAEERKRVNGESVRLVVFLIPITYVGSFMVSVTMLGMSPARFLRNQFATSEGFGFFVASVFLFFINLVLIEVITNRKLDF